MRIDIPVLIEMDSDNVWVSLELGIHALNQKKLNQQTIHQIRKLVGTIYVRVFPFTAGQLAYIYYYEG